MNNVNEINNNIYDKLNIKNVLLQLFPNLNNKDLIFLKKSVIDLLNYIWKGFVFPDYKSYNDILTFNNNQDLKSIILLILPFINEKANKKNIKSLSDIYTEKNDKFENINHTAPKYTYSNIQYNRCDRNPSGYTEYQFIYENIEDNIKLLKYTINTISNKLYINWIYITPYNLFNYRESPLYINTLNTFNKNGYSDELVKNNLYISDIYNILINDFYYSVKKNRWLIYDIQCKKLQNINNNYNVKAFPHKNDSNNNYLYPIIIILNNIVNLNECIFNTNWDDLTDEYKNDFTLNFKKIINSLSNNNSIIVNNYELDHKSILTIVMSILEYFNIDYINTKKKNKDYNLNNYKEITNVKDFKENININKIKEHFVSINMVYLYDFMKKSLQKIKILWFGKKITNEDGTIKLLSEYMPFENKNINITIKMLYNYSKSLCHHGLDFDEYSYTWVSLTSNDKLDIIKRLNDTLNDKKWFNISRYISEYIKNNDIPMTDSTEVINNNIYKDIRKVIITCIFENLIYRGLLSEFKINTNIFDSNKNIFINKANSFLKKNKNDFEKAYYYVNRLQYKNIAIDNELNYIDYLINNNFDWYNIYALNWVSQISFFHKYLNNRIIYVTGSTGVGKSTQIPKLLYYSLSMINNKNNGNIICTIPTKKAIKDTASRIATEMGIPLFNNLNNSNNSNKTQNYYIQYQHADMNDSHVLNKNIKVNHNILKFTIDKILELQLYNSPFLKKKIDDDLDYSEEMDKDTEQVFTEDNLYDIVIIDEAHQHNNSIDIILTLMKYAAYYNNSLKLVIISATMDQDESIYRRYYRDICDNRLYPLNTYIQDNKLDRINVDRRIHISPPDNIPTHIIHDIYLSENHTPHNVIINTILKESTKGDILVFLQGSREIIDLVESLNREMPDNVIAVPFFNKMHQSKQNLITQIRTIKLSKEVTFDKYDFDKIYNNEKYYDRVVIVATNIVEASITIDTLKFVIDSGKQKINTFNFETNNESLISVDISESSRIQRRGRVGRKSSGTVYYLYPKGSKENITHKYDISKSDISELMFDLLNTTENNPLINYKNDPNKYNNIIKYNTLNKYYDRTISKIIEKQYFINNKFYDYWGNNKDYDYNNTQSPVSRNISGYSKENINDDSGIFYIIHPEEHNFKRNINGQIISNNIDINNNKLAFFWNVLYNFLFVEKKSNIKTNFGKLVNEFKKKYIEDNISLEFIISYLYSIKLKCNHDMIKLIAIYMVCNKDISKIFKKKNKLNVNNISDSQVILNILADKHNHKRYNLNDEIMTYYNSFLEKLNSKYNDLKDKKNLKMLLEIIDINYNDSDINKISLSFMHGFCHNIAKKIRGTPFYINIYYPNQYNIYSINAHNMQNTFIKDNYEYILYLNKDIETKTISIIHNINLTQIRYLSYIFTPTLIQNYNNNYSNVLIDIINNINQDASNNKYIIYIINSYINTINNIKYDLTKNYDRHIWNKFIKYDKIHTFKEFIYNNINKRGGNINDNKYMNISNDVFFKYLLDHYV
jgi:hypothetical protein